MSDSLVEMMIERAERGGAFTYPAESFGGLVERCRARSVVARLLRHVVDALAKHAANQFLSLYDARMLYRERSRLTRLIRRRSGR